MACEWRIILLLRPFRDVDDSLVKPLVELKAIFQLLALQVGRRLILMHRIGQYGPTMRVDLESSQLRMDELW